MKILNQFKYKLLPVLLIAVLLLPFFYMPVNAATDETAIDTTYLIESSLGKVVPYDFLLNHAIAGFYAELEIDPDIPIYYIVPHGGTYGDVSAGLDVMISLNPFYCAKYPSSKYIFFNSVSTIYRVVVYTSDGGFSLRDPVSVNTVGTSYQCLKARYIESSHNVFFGSSNQLILRGSLVIEPDKPDYNFEFSIYDKFQDFYEQSHEFNDAAHKQTITENPNNPNDGVFQSLLVSLADLQHTGNSIMQQISSQLQNFSENFFGNFAQYSLGLLTDIKDGIGTLIDAVIPDNLEAVIDAIYTSGLDPDGNFGLDTFFDFWFIPEEDYFGTIFNQLSSDRTGLFQVFDIMDYMKSGLLSLEPTAPVIRIPGGTYGFLTIPDIELGFTWFEAWKTYTDPLIAAFLYVTYAWHLILQIPGIISGGAGTVASGNHYESNEIRRENNERLRGR